MFNVGTKLIFLVLFFGLGIPAASGQKKGFAADLLNSTIESSCPNDRARSIKLKNGKHNRITLLADGDPDPEFYEVKGFVDLNITGDRRKEMILYAECRLNGVGGHELLIYRRSASGPTLVARASNGLLGFASVRSITFKNGLIIVAMNYREFDGVPKTEDHFEFRYKLNGRKLSLESFGLVPAKPATKR